MTSWQSPPFIVANLICTRMGSDISSWRMSIGLFYGAMYGAITKRYIVIWLLLVEGQLDPQFDQATVNVTAIQGEDAVMPCAVINKGTYQIIWMNPRRILLSTEDRRVIDDSRMSVERPFVRDWNLLIRHVTVDDNGQYTCQINTDPIQIKRVWLTVHVPAQIDNESSSVDTIVREGDTVKLTCVASGIPEPKISWFRKTLHSQQAREKVGEDGEMLLIHNITRYCGGLYECEAQNGIGTGVHRSINVDVEFPPEVSFRTPARIGQYVDKEVLLECFITAFPHGVSQWKKDGVPVTGQNSWKYRTEIYKENHFKVALYLRILNLDVADFGKYTCEASNNLGTDSMRMHLYEYVVPTTPKPIPQTPAVSHKTIGQVKYNQGPADDQVIMYDQEIRAENSRGGPGSRAQGSHISGYMGAGDAYNSSKSIVLSRIYQTIITVLALTFSIILTREFVR